MHYEVFILDNIRSKTLSTNTRNLLKEDSAHIGILFILNACTRKIYFTWNMIGKGLGASSISLFLNFCRPFSCKKDKTCLIFYY